MDQIADGIGLNALLADAPGHPVIWKQFLVYLTQQLKCDSSALLVTNLTDRRKTHFLFSINIPLEYQNQYENELNRLDIFNYFISKKPRQVFCNQTLENTYIDELDSGFIPSYDQNYRFGVSIPSNHNHSLNLLVYRKEMFNDAERRRAARILQTVIPTLEQAIHAEQQHRINSQLLHYIGSRFDGYIIIDRKLNIVFSDPVCTSLISQLDCVKLSGNRFGMKNPAIEQRLLSLVENNEEVASIHHQCPSCQIALIPIAYLKNLYQWESYKNGFVLAFTYDKEENPTLNRLSDIYHLSQCEAVCALNFMKTPSIRNIAANTYRSQETVRNHIKHTMQKMDVHNQAELMKQLITLAAL